MKNIKFVVAALCLMSAAGVTAVAPVSAANVISKDVATEGSYCHMKFPAIREETLGASAPVLTDSNDVIDFYGSCDHDPLGKDEIQAQLLQLQQRRDRGYSS